MITHVKKRKEPGPAGESCPGQKAGGRAGGILGPGTTRCLPCWLWEKWVPCKQVRPHLCPPGIAPLFDGHRWGLEGGQDDVVS